MAQLTVPSLIERDLDRLGLGGLNYNAMSDLELQRVARYAKVGEYFLGSGTRIATNYIFYVSPGIRHSLLGGKIAIRLMRIFTDWARAQGANEINIHATSGIEPQQTHKFLQKVGFAQYGGNYAAQLD